MKDFKKYLPVVIVLAVFAVGLGSAIFAYKQFNKTSSNEVEDEGPELPASQRPYASLTPTIDGHYMDLVISNINVPDAKKIEFELFYTTGEGNNQGTKGSVTLKGNDVVKNQILLGSESNGKFRYDTGVEIGTLTIKFRDASGKVIGRTATTWKLLSDTTDLASADGKFSYKLEDSLEDTFFVVMPTLGLPGPLNATAASEAYGVFTSSEDEVPGEVTLGGSLHRWDDKASEWVALDGTSSDNVGVFISTN